MRRKLNRWPALVAVCTLAGLWFAAGPAVPRAAASAPSGWAPADLVSAYGFPSATSGIGMTVAVVTAYDDPAAESDLGVYRAQYGLPACTTANGCFRKVNQSGGTSYPSPGWSAQDAQSLEAVSAVCPNCHILLVEATSSAITDLGAAENEAVALGAKFVDNDWSILESELKYNETSYDTYFNHPGVAITAPSGNSGYGVSYPAASQYVIAVGGTVLTKDSSAARGWDETAWASSGSGCSAYEHKPSWQTDNGCTGRTLNDVAAVATNVAYYDTPTSGGWNTGSGTGISAAIIAAAYALAGDPAAGSYPASSLYANPTGLYDITTGSNGHCSQPYPYLCTASSGYDGPTGLGTPDGVGAFFSSYYIGVLTSSGSFLVKQGGLNAHWVTENTGVKAGVVSAAPLRIGVLTSSGSFLVKEGGLSTTWTDEHDGVTQGVISGDMIGVLTSSGSFLVKQGGLSALWDTENTGVKAGVVSAATSTTPLRIGILTNSGSFLVKEGSLTATWTDEHDGVIEGTL